MRMIFVIVLFWLILLSQDLLCQGCLVASYNFSGNANDDSGNSLHGTVVGATLTTDRYSNPNSAYRFNGTSDYITVPHNPLMNFDINEDFSITCWVRVPLNHNWTPSNQRNIILTKWEDNTTGNSGYSYTMALMNQTSGVNNGKVSCFVYDINLSLIHI